MSSYPFPPQRQLVILCSHLPPKLLSDITRSQHMQLHGLCLHSRDNQRNSQRDWHIGSVCSPAGSKLPTVDNFGGIDEVCVTLNYRQPHLCVSVLFCPFRLLSPPFPCFFCVLLRFAPHAWNSSERRGERHTKMFKEMDKVVPFLIREVPNLNNNFCRSLLHLM